MQLFLQIRVPPKRRKLMARNQSCPLELRLKAEFVSLMGTQVNEERCDGASLGQASRGTPVHGEERGMTW